MTITGPDGDRAAREASIAESGVVRWDDGEVEVVGDGEDRWVAAFRESFRYGLLLTLTAGVIVGAAYAPAL